MDLINAETIRKVKILTIPEDVIVELVCHQFDTESVHRLMITNLPDDAFLVSVRFNPVTGAFETLIESDTYPAIPIDDMPATIHAEIQWWEYQDIEIVEAEEAVVEDVVEGDTPEQNEIFPSFPRHHKLN